MRAAAAAAPVARLRRFAAPLSAASAAAANTHRCGRFCVAARASLSSDAGAPGGPPSESSCTAPADEGPPVPELVSWVRGRGGSVEGATLADLAGRDGGSGWGLKATRDLPAGARLIELPQSCLLTYDAATGDPKLLALIEKVPEELWGGRLALALLAHRTAGPASPFAPYVSHLPRGFPGVPMFFPREAIEAIDYPPVVEQVKKRCRWLYRFSTDALAGLRGTAADPFGGAALDINALGWGLAAVTSRAFRVRGPAHPAAMLPLIDMANHSFEPNAEVVPAAGGGVTMVAKRALTAGEPLLLSYGPLSNDFLLMDYGFTVPDNPHDRVTARFDVDLLNAGAAVANVMDGSSFLELDAAAGWRRRVLAELRLTGPEADLGVQVGGPRHVDPRLLAATRCLVARYQSEVEGRGMDVLGDWDKPLNKQNEIASLRTLLGVCSVLLSNFKTSRDEDLQLLGEGKTAGQSSDGGQPAEWKPLGEELRTAVGFRAERKRVLLQAIRALSNRVRIVAGMPDLREGPVVLAKKGEKPRPATDRGFATGGGGGSGSGKGSGGGKRR